MGHRLGVDVGGTVTDVQLPDTTADQRPASDARLAAEYRG
jgi:N-methylhydantoinase A/oxoprolinase/acetone carboxylase beta subunit